MDESKLSHAPPRYPTAVVGLPQIPKGWDGQGQVRGALPLLGASYVEGPISGGSYAEIVGAGEVKTKTGYEKRYQLDGEFSEKWIVCRYGNDGSVELFHRVATTATQCVIRTTQSMLPKLPVIQATCH